MQYFNADSQESHLTNSFKDLENYIETKLTEYKQSSNFDQKIKVFSDFAWKMREKLLAENRISSEIIASYWSWIVSKVWGLELSYEDMFKRDDLSGEYYYSRIIKFLERDSSNLFDLPSEIILQIMQKVDSENIEINNFYSMSQELYVVLNSEDPTNLKKNFLMKYTTYALNNEITFYSFSNENIYDFIKKEIYITLNQVRLPLIKEIPAYKYAKPLNNEFFIKWIDPLKVDSMDHEILVAKILKEKETKILVPRYYGIVELKGHYFLLMENVKGEALIYKDYDEQTKNKILDEVKEYLLSIEEIKYFGDHHAGNVVIGKDEKIYIIDLERIKLKTF